MGVRMNKIRDFLLIFKQLIFMLNAKQRYQSIVIFGLIIMNGICDMLGISIIVPFVQALLTPDILKNNSFISKCASAFNINTDSGIIFLLAIGIIIIFSFKNLFLIFSNYIQIRFRTQVKKDLSVEMMNSYLSRPYTFFLDTNTSDIISGVGHWVDCTYIVLENIFYFMSNSIRIVLLSAYIFLSDPGLAVGVIFIAMVVTIILVLFFKPKMGKAGIAQRDAIIEQSKWAIQSIGGIKDIKVTNRKDEFLNKYAEAYENRRRAEVSFNFMTVCPNPIIETLAICGIVFTICIKIKMGADLSNFIPALVTLAMAIIMILPAVSGLLNCINQIIFNKPAMSNAYANLKEARILAIEEQMDLKDVINVGKLEKKVEIKNVSWTYPKSQQRIINNLSITINKGESVALIGTSGGGKTTLADIILGLLKPQEGAICIDEININKIGSNWNKLVGYVPQSVYLLDDTIRANILFGLEADEDSEKKIWEVLEQAQLKDVVKGLPLGLETLVGERGIKFSGGQRQRIAIARALYYNPEILVLDEATSALDTETEVAVMEAINALQGKKTMVIIAHRLETIRNCDSIYEVSNGKALKRRKEEIFQREKS